MKSNKQVAGPYVLLGSLNKSFRDFNYIKFHLYAVQNMNKLHNTFCSSFLAQTRSVWKEILIISSFLVKIDQSKISFMPPKIGARGRLPFGVPTQSKEFFNCFVANCDESIWGA